MDIIQVIIFIIIIVAAIVQQISKTGKEKKTPSPKKVLADMFPENRAGEHRRGPSCFLPFKQSANLRLPACSISRWSRSQQIHPGKRTKGKTGLL